MSEKNPPIRPSYAVPLTDYLAVRVPKQMAVMLKTQAMQHGTDVSAVMRQLIKDGAASRGLDTKFY